MSSDCEGIGHLPAVFKRLEMRLSARQHLRDAKTDSRAGQPAEQVRGRVAERKQEGAALDHDERADREARERRDARKSLTVRSRFSSFGVRSNQKSAMPISAPTTHSTKSVPNANPSSR
jgi:hypothetical protein